MNGRSNLSCSGETEVSSRATRRRFTAEYKKRILDEVEALTERGEVGALLRREGLYSSHLAAWRAERRAGELSGLEPKRRGSKPKEAYPLAKELEAKEREIARLKAENATLALICDVQKNSRSSWG
ncbi:MAG: transposase [Labilithrix sp.]|nr:transposase [Labilithrix sp.]